jgi:copper chaperone
MQFHVENMTCGGCVRGVTRAIQSVDPAAEVAADLATHDVEVKTSAARELLAKALAEAGFETA